MEHLSFTPTTEYFHDARGNEIAEKDARGNVRVNRYDEVGQLIETVRADNGFTRYHLDRFGRRVAIENAAQIDPSADGGVTVNITWRTYNRNDQVTEQYINEGLNRVRYEYDERGLESKRSAAISVMGVTTPEDQKWVDTHIRFDRRGNLMLSEVQSPDDALSLAQKTAITYDLKGNKRTELTGNLDQTAANEWENDYFGRWKRGLRV